MAEVVFIGGFTDAGGWAIINGKLVRIPGWNPEEFLELEHAVSIVRQAVQFKTPGLTERIVESVLPVINEQMQNLRGADVAIVD